jgi:hypothetical protein
MDKSELVAPMKAIYALSDAKRRFLESRFAQDRDQVDAILTDYKQEIEYCFFESGTSLMNRPG